MDLDQSHRDQRGERLKELPAASHQLPARVPTTDNAAGGGLLDDLGFETGEADGVVGRDGCFPAGDVDLLSRRCDSGDRWEQEPGATSGAIDDYAVPGRVEVVEVVDRFGITEQVDGDVETIDLPRLERGESWIGGRRCHGEANDLASERALSGSYGADTASQ